MGSVISSEKLIARELMIKMSNSMKMARQAAFHGPKEGTINNFPISPLAA
jgi:hypothetical protein